MERANSYNLNYINPNRSSIHSQCHGPPTGATASQTHPELGTGSLSLSSQLET